MKEMDDIDAFLAAHIRRRHILTKTECEEYLRLVSFSHTMHPSNSISMQPYIPTSLVAFYSTNVSIADC